MDKMKITILADGTIKTESDKISGPNHSSATNFLSTVAKLAGGKVKSVSKGAAHTHATHEHKHEH